ncbi:hypothetical protein L210DRAFT_3544258 [Boletus edulis BED1]|uniref:Uncharacterized protein n=1 Tax=Boletus edulis BED1 TaxID=1328754 RepID=A0AAD4GEK2_BOLED|nr:hypothetical protein L210DRAFT_3544258 [Boletus edulis BED1]
MNNPNLTRYVVQSSDVISDLRVNVFEENSTRVLWYKERFLSDQEIVEHIVHNQTSTICWIIHRPKQGWYIRIRSPTFPPGVFISLLPVPRCSPNFTDAALSFSCRTNVYPSPPTSVAADNHKSSTDSLASDSTAVHSYPPTPPSVPVVTTAPSPPPIDAKLDAIISVAAKISKSTPKVIPTRITQFLLAPHSSPHVSGPQPGEQRSLFTRALSLFQNNRPSHSTSFTLCALDKPGYTQQVAGSSQPRQRLSQLIPKIPTPLLTFHDRTPILTVGSFTGLLEIERAEERILGVDTSFWIAVALTYLEFLEERESYLAALTD